MTDEQKYNAVLKELGAVLQDKNTAITCLKWQIDGLKAKLAAAEAERDNAKEELDIVNAQVLAMADEICKLKGGAA